MSWLTHTTMAIAIQGRVVLTDTFIARLETTPGWPAFVIKDVVDLHPEAIFNTGKTGVKKTSYKTPQRRRFVI